jgi:hypothetical protein
VGEPADLSAAKYDGDFSLSREEAQRRKHCYVAEQIGIGPGRRIPTCAVSGARCSTSSAARAAAGSGVTLSSARAAACRRHGLDVHLHDAREVTPRHVRSVRRRGEPRGLRALVLSGGPPRRAPGRALSRTLRPDRECAAGQGRFVLQTMVFGRSVIPAERIDIRARRGSDAWYLALMGRQVPGSWPPPWPGADHSQRRAALPPRVKHERPARLHRNHPPVAEALRERRASGRRLSSSGFCRAGLRAPISGSRSPRASAPTGSALSGSCWTTIGSCSRRSFAVWLTDSVACGRFGPGALVRIGDG